MSAYYTDIFIAVNTFYQFFSLNNDLMVWMIKNQSTLSHILSYVMINYGGMVSRYYKLLNS
ncbi:hypothetical protein C0210_03485 [Moraxella catarrhalis]|nr:hypothetical protein [Moraxella catarrhalis]